MTEKPKRRLKDLEARVAALEARLEGPAPPAAPKSEAELLEADWSAAVPALSALAHPSRIAMLRLVLRGEAHTAADLSAREETGTSGQVYHHLRQLVAAGWLKPGERGRHAVPEDRVGPLLSILAAAGA